ncbi:hypothetical protein H0B56_00150 [Haloechinothrix sp. YIM 98757]|uniref:Uncharacterized protein n=1 Tax=Haloechinothrix aidingensis TaxID=2752311 RepID=A0A838A6S4_9PSEU|nr:hypothetical protein [Haloechinothrix aidingensis]MBA0123951.1 hypothetical protein [Haloechinothrix aidingensis]
MTLRAVLSACVLALTVALGGCGVSGSVSVEHDKGLREELTTLRDRGESKPFNEVVPGDWDQAHLVIGPKSGERIREMTDLDVELRGDGTFQGSFTQDGNLIILTRDGEVVRMISTGQSRVFGEGTVSSSAILHGNPDSPQIRVANR